MPLVYHFDKQTGALTGVSEAHESPAEPGVFLLPAWATFKPLPGAVPEGHTAFFVAGEWKTLPGDRVVAEALALGLIATDEEKARLVREWVEHWKSFCIQMLAFADAASVRAHAAASAGAVRSQRDQDAADLLQWFRAVDNKTDEIVAALQGTTTPLPTPEAISELLPAFARTTYQDENGAR